MFIKSFSEITKADAAIAGGKGASLGEMTSSFAKATDGQERGYNPVPPGFVVLSQAFEQFLKKTDLAAEIDTILHTVDTRAMHTVEHASERIQRMILEAKMPDDIKGDIQKHFEALGAEYVAVRSSATAEDSASAAWAGQLDSFLNTTEATLLKNVQKCWASLFTPRAIFYRFEQGLHSTHISVAVVVQKMVESEVSGIAFSVHPVTEDRNQLIIEAGYGLGEAIVSGQITPDSYVVEKSPRRIMDKNIAKQERGIFRKALAGNEWREIESSKRESQKLSDEQILTLSEIIIGIEKHYDFPCDIEWAYEKGVFYIVQSRPITTLLKEGVKKIENQFGSADQWQRLFKMRGLGYLISDLWVNRKPDGIFCAVVNNEFTSYLLRTEMEKTLNEGVEMLSNRESFKNYRDSFVVYMKEMAACIDATLTGKSIDMSKLEVFLDLVVRGFGFYSKTEFYFTDRAYINATREQSQEKLEILEEHGRLKNDARAFFNTIFFGEKAALNRILICLSKEFLVPVENLLQYSQSELSELLNGKVVEQEAIKRRKLAFYMWGEKNGLVIETGEPAQRAITSFLELVKPKEGEVITGIIAHGGNVTGRAKVVVSGYHNFDDITSQIEAMQKGDILVSETTSPELMAACKKAGGIVTNQGGLLSHAAIVSRELNIPCVVGISNATDLIKDGDLVEVDADNGVVRIIKKSEEDEEYWIRSFSADECPYQLSVPYLQPGMTIAQTAWRELGSNDGLTQSIMYYHGSVLEGGYFLEREVSHLVEAATNMIYQHPERVMDNHRETYRLNDTYASLARTCIKTPLEQLSNADLAAMHHELTLLQARSHAWSQATTWYVDSLGGTFSAGLLEKTKEIVMKQGSKRNPAEVFTLLTTHPKNGFTLEEELESLEVVVAILQDKKAAKIFEGLRDYTGIPEGIAEKLRKLMVNHYEQWCFTPFGYYGPAYGLDYYLSVWAGMVREKTSVEARRKELKERPETIERERKALFEELAIPADMQRVYDVAADITFLKGYRKDCMYLGFYAIDFIFREVSRRLGIPLTDLYLLTYPEIGDLLRGAKEYDRAERDRRKRSAIQHWDGERLVLLSGEEAEKFFHSQLVKRERVESESGSLKGNCASSGYAKGRVKIVNKTEAMGKVEAGDIMVSHTTFPALVPAMKKAGAIVTEDGGITCHAAIVARELKKPCVTGIKAATQVLQDGDLVEVDADNGVVRIVKRAQ